MAEVFDRIDPIAWKMVTEHMPKPWPREVAVADLEHHRSATHRGVKFPGRPTLCKRWGWTDWKVYSLLVEVDPLGKAADQQPTNSRPTADQQAPQGGTPNIEPKPTADQQPTNSKPTSRDPMSEEEEEGKEEILSAEPTLPPAAPTLEAEPRSAEPPPSKLEGLPPSGRGCKPQWLTAPVLEVYRAWYKHHPEARAIRADQVKAIRGALAQGYTPAQLVTAVRYVHEAPEDMPKVRALREGGYLDLTNTLNGNTRHSNVELGEAWLAGGMSGGKAPAAADTAKRPGPTELELRRWYDLEGGRAKTREIAGHGWPKAIEVWREFIGDWRRTDDWALLEAWMQADRRTA